MAVWALSCGASSVHCFEPDTINRTSLKNNADRYGNGKIVIVPYAVGNETCDVQFFHDHISYASSKVTEISALSNTIVPIIRIDDYVSEHNIKPSFESAIASA